MASVLKVGVLIFCVLVNTHLYVFYSYAVRVVKVVAALAVRLLALNQLVLRIVSVVRYPVRRSLLLRVRSKRNRPPFVLNLPFALLP